MADDQAQLAENDLRSFFSRYKHYADSQFQGRLDHAKQWFGMARAALDGFRQLDAAWQRACAPYFNVFHVLGLERYEVRTHSAFLSELLNPTGSHGQGALFLGLFLERVVGLPGAQELAQKGDWEVVTEYAEHHLDGRIDILLRSNLAQTLVAIENKIDAVDQPKQLERYWCWLEKQRLHKYATWKHVELVYLSIDTLEAPGENHRAKPKTYKADIATWLDTVRGEISAPQVGEVVRQYAELVKAL